MPALPEPTVLALLSVIALALLCAAGLWFREKLREIRWDNPRPRRQRH
jgi:hypothetical protein